jgi:hypothetical protein
MIGIKFYRSYIYITRMNRSSQHCFKIILCLFLGLILIVCFISRTDCRDQDVAELPETFESFESLRQKRIYNLNKDRGKLGNFYVQCHKCGRAGLLEEKEKSLQANEKKCFKFKNYSADSCPGSVTSIPGAKDSCTSTCEHCKEKNQTMSFFNKQYIDMDQAFCYNCLMDAQDKAKAYDVPYEANLLRNFNNFPPVNGPPGIGTGNGNNAMTY